MYIKSFLFFLTFFLAIAISTVSAQKDSSKTKIELEELLGLSIEELMNVKIKVASKQATDILRTPSSVTIISQNTIKRYNFQTIAEAVQTVAGVSVYRTYLKRNIPTARGILQEHYANKILVLINGVACWNAVTGEGNLERIDINDVKQIEVLKGPASVLYGTNAYSGAINIVLKSENEEDQLETHAGLGSSFSIFSGANSNSHTENFSFFVSGNSLNIMSPSSIFVGEDNNPIKYNEVLQSSNLTFTANHKNHKLLFNAYHGTESYLGVIPAVGSDSSSGGAGNPQFLKATLGSYSYNNQLTDKISIIGSADIDWQQRDLSRSKNDSIRSIIQGYSTNLTLGSNLKITDYLSFEMYANTNYRLSQKYANYLTITDSLTLQNNMKNKSINEESVFGQAIFSFSNFQSLIGARYTSNSKFGQNVSPRITLLYVFNDKNSLKLIYGESFRTPSLFEFNFVANTVYGNPNLKPETSKSAEIAYLTSFENLFIQVLAYHGIYENKIYRSTDSTLTRADGKINTDKSFTYNNGQPFSANGLELELKYSKPEIINLFLNYSLVMGEDKVDNPDREYSNFKFIPQHTISAGISKQFLKNFSISGVYNYFSKTNGPSKEIQAQQIIDVNLSAKHKFNRLQLEHIFSVKNLTNKDFLFPEYVRRKNINEIPYGFPRFISYTIRIKIND